MAGIMYSTVNPEAVFEAQITFQFSPARLLIYGLNRIVDYRPKYMMVFKRLWRQRSCLVLLFALLPCLLLAQIYVGPIPKPSGGYGADGQHVADSLQFANPLYAQKSASLYYPEGISSAVPTVFYAHGFGGESPAFYEGFLKFVASKGFAAVFVPYAASLEYSVEERYQMLEAGFVKAARDFPEIIDTTRVGFAGHSFGAGALIALSHSLFTDYGWGTDARFIAPMAPWYSYDISQGEILDFPANAKMLMFLFDEDNVNDHRLGIEVFRNINIAHWDKDLIYVSSDTIEGHNYLADHGLPTTFITHDALDYFSVYRLVDALMDLCFKGREEARQICLGDGADVQVAMPGGLKNLRVGDTLSAYRPETYFLWPCSGPLNPRAEYCETVISSLSVLLSSSSRLTIYPNPTTGWITLSHEDSREVFYSLVNIQGQELKSGRLGPVSIQLDVSDLPFGCYFVKTEFGIERLMVAHR